MAAFGHSSTKTSTTMSPLLVSMITLMIVPLQALDNGNSTVALAKHKNLQCGPACQKCGGGGGNSSKEQPMRLRASASALQLLLPSQSAG